MFSSRDFSLFFCPNGREMYLTTSGFGEKRGKKVAFVQRWETNVQIQVQSGASSTVRPWEMNAGRCILGTHLGLRGEPRELGLILANRRFWNLTWSFDNGNLLQFSALRTPRSCFPSSRRVAVSSDSIRLNNGSTERLSRWWDINGRSFIRWCPYWDVFDKVVSVPCWQNCTLSNFNRQKFNFSSSDSGGSQPVRRRQISVVSDLSLKCLYTFPVFKSVLECMAHCSRQELNDELSVCSQISAWLPLVCMKESAGIGGKKWQLRPNKSFMQTLIP